MRIVHLINSIDPVSGGPANVLARLAPVQVNRGHEVTIISADGPAGVTEIDERLTGAGVRVEPKGPGSGPFAKRLERSRNSSERSARASMSFTGTGCGSIWSIGARACAGRRLCRTSSARAGCSTRGAFRRAV
ncbi:MAG: hypothetical protein ACFHWZ_08840 [Phycisphaerales bacterium]